VAINGNIKFFKHNIVSGNNLFSFTSADSDNANYLYDDNLSRQLVSVGSNDATPEVWVITVGGGKSFDRIFIGNHNIKDGLIEYWDGAAYQAFSPSVNLSSNAESNSYFEFTEVESLQIRITMNTTIVADEEKSVGQFRLFSEIGTVIDNPVSANPTFDESTSNFFVDDRGNRNVFYGSKYSSNLRFDNAFDTDLALFRTLKDLNASFYVYPSGGIDRDEFGFRLEDMYLVNYVNAFSYELPSNLFDVGVIISLELRGV
jgi:hypothetical protein